MAYNDNFNPADNMDFSVGDENKKFTENFKKSDRGYNTLWRSVEKNGVMKRSKIEVYTSNGIGCRIRDAETGLYYPHIVGSADEDLYFSLILATGECNSKNGSNTLFYISPQHYMTHFNCELDPDTIAHWESKRNMRLKELSAVKPQSGTSVIVK